MSIALVTLAVAVAPSVNNDVAVGQQVRVIAERAPVRLQPDIGSPAIADIMAGTLLEVERDLGEWIVV